LELKGDETSREYKVVFQEGVAERYQIHGQEQAFDYLWDSCEDFENNKYYYKITEE
jgi:hypothetical protein